MKSPRVPIRIELPHELCGAEILLASDIHNGSAQFSEKKWKAFEEMLSRPNTYVIFAGDQMEYATRTSKSDVYTQKLSPRQQKDWWIDHLKPYAAEKCLCIVDGNHEFNRASKDADDFPLYDIALALGIQDRYRSEAAFVDIGVGSIKSGTRQVHYVGRICHKAHNGKYCTADSIEGIDFFVSGHVHTPKDLPLGKLIYDTSNKTVYEKTVENIVCGHFLDFGSYIERDGGRPASHKMYSIIMSGKKKAIETRGFHL